MGAHSLLPSSPLKPSSVTSDRRTFPVIGAQPARGSDIAACSRRSPVNRLTCVNAWYPANGPTNVMRGLPTDLFYHRSTKIAGRVALLVISSRPRILRSRVGRGSYEGCRIEHASGRKSARHQYGLGHRLHEGNFAADVDAFYCSLHRRALGSNRAADVQQLLGMAPSINLLSARTTYQETPS